MERAHLQRMIDGRKDVRQMLEIAVSYLDGTVIRDPVAAEAWLMKVINADDPSVSPEAMVILATRILGKNQIITEEDYQYMLRSLQTAGDRERLELETLLRLVENDQKN